MNQASQPARALVGAGEQHRGHLNAQGFGGLDIDNQLVLGRRLHRQVAGLLSLEDAIDVAGRLPVLVDIISPIGDQATGNDEGTFWANCRQLMSDRQRGYHLAMMRRRRAPCHDQTAIRGARECRDGALQLGCVAHIDCNRLYTDRRRYRPPVGPPSASHLQPVRTQRNQPPGIAFLLERHNGDRATISSKHSGVGSRTHQSIKNSSARSVA
jgi:hypothetical protein